VHAELTAVLDRLVTTLTEDPRVHGGWFYGSVGRGQWDELSDYDVVFLVDDADFEAVAADVPTLVAGACDELLISWPEDYNSAVFKNFCNLVRTGQTMHQLDFFMVNADHVEDWWCRQHLKSATRDNLVFDRDGRVGELLDRGLRTDDDRPDPQRCFDTYWFHAEMLIKYFLRGDAFKILKNLDFLRQSHADLLLSRYDTLDWGGWESKVKHCVPAEKQAHLLTYATTADLASMRAAVLRGMEEFDADAREVFAVAGLQYRGDVAETIRAYVVERTAGVSNGVWPHARACQGAALQARP
jgi:predicted nucleotidyltransferase